MKSKIKNYLSIVLNIFVVGLLVVLLFKSTGKKNEIQYVTQEQLQKTLNLAFKDLSKSLSTQLSDRLKPIENQILIITNTTPETIQQDYKYVPRGYDFCVVDQKPVLYDNTFKDLFQVGSVCPFSPGNIIEEIGTTYIVLSNGEFYIRDTRNNLIMEGMAELAGRNKK